MILSRVIYKASQKQAKRLFCTEDLKKRYHTDDKVKLSTYNDIDFEAIKEKSMQKEQMLIKNFPEEAPLKRFRLQVIDKDQYSGKRQWIWAMWISLMIAYFGGAFRINPF